MIKNFSVIFIWIYFFIGACNANEFLNDNKNTFLKVDDAFQISVKKEINNNFYTVSFKIAKGYYLYKDKIKIILNGKELKDFNFPKSIIINDEFFGESKIYKKDFFLKVKVKEENNFIEVGYQGCANKGLCYPPITKKFNFNLLSVSTEESSTKISETEKIYEKLLSNNIFVNIFFFIVFGLLLSFTPCVLPMVPILSGIIINSNKSKKLKPFILSLNYVFGLCVLYFLVGLFVGYTTETYNIQSAFQDPIFLILFIMILTLLALSMFGLYEIKMPNFVQTWVNSLSINKNNSNYSTSFLMGFFSALIVGPCIAPPLAGIFMYVSSKNPGAFITALLFLSLSLGMSIPLLLYGTFMGKYIPKTGKWMKYINYFFGILLLIVALTFLDRLIPIININHQESNLNFQRIENVSELKKFLSSNDGNIAFLDVYADWCIECKLMEQKTFKNKSVEKILNELKLIKIDVTKNNAQDIELLKYLNVIGPPAYRFYNESGEEIKGFNIQGYMPPEEFLEHLGDLKKY